MLIDLYTHDIMNGGPIEVPHEPLDVILLWRRYEECQECS